MYYIEGIHGVVNFFRRQIGRDKPLWSIQYRGRPYYMEGAYVCIVKLKIDLTNLTNRLSIFQSLGPLC